MQLLDELAKMKKCTESALSVELTEADYAPVRDEIEHLFLYHVCRGAVRHCAPWIYQLEGRMQSAVIEVLASLLEIKIRELCKLPQQSIVMLVNELRHYPIKIDQAGFEHLNGFWDAYFWPEKDLSGMAAYTKAFFEHGQMVTHILPRKDWEAAQEAGVYAPVSLEAEGFIHCSTIAQVIGTANLFFKGQEDLLLLWIVEAKLDAEIRYEDLPGDGILFPHIYGPLNLDAVVDVRPLLTRDDGQFILPSTKPV
jgi:uncharacterized protein (DUF952 family)